jgi:Fur family ferric uptake transcriptional regulator
MRAGEVLSADAVGVRSAEDAIAFLRTRRIKITVPRRLLLEALTGSPHHRSADALATEVQAGSPRTSRSTIYRNLEELEQLGLVVHAHLGHGPATYHLAANAHPHLVCERCGAADAADPDLLVGLQATLAERYGFTLNPSHAALLGVCARCGSA